MKKQVVKKQTIPEPKTYLKPWMLIVSVLIVAFLVGAVIYSGQQNIIKDKEKDLERSQSRISELSSQLSQIEEYIRSNMTQSEATTTENILYTNTEKGFSFEFPKSWEKYVAKDRQLKFSVVGFADSVDFYFDEENPVFNIGLIGKDIWDSVKDLSYYTPTKIAENENYVFAYSIAKGADENFVSSKQEDINIILNSLQILDTDSTTGTSVDNSNLNATPNNLPVAE